MKKILLCAGAACIFAMPASAAVYTVNLSGNGVSADGSITTDGSLGVLSNANVTDWLLNLDDGTSQFTLTGPDNSQLAVSGSGFTATATGLYFDFSGAGYVLFQNPALGSGMNFLCFAGNSVCGGASNRVSISVNQFGGGFGQQGVQLVAGSAAGAVPEPEAWALMILGFGMVGAGLRASRRTKVSFAAA